MINLFSINGHGIYIATAFGLSTAILIFNLWLPIRRYRQIIKPSKKTDESSS